MKLLRSFAGDHESAGAAVTCWVLLASILLRLFYLNFPCLLPEEAYYWQYAEHLDIGYLDHPPMVALTIFLGTKIFGVTEFGVRIGALLWWGMAAIFVHLLSREIFGKKTANASILLFSALPFFFGTGFFVTPDSPLIAFWAGTLYFLYKALVDQHERAWWGVGFCLGLGMLSKYSIALLGIASLAYMILDAKSRHYFLNFRPYMAAIVASLLFSPVLIWNYENGWASFAFQSADRLTEPMKFSLHLLLLHIVAVLSPFGVHVFVKSLVGLWHEKARLFRAAQRETNLFVWVFTLIPLLAFAFFSLTHEVKMNWTGPIFLAFLPVLGRSLVLGVSGRHRMIEDGWQWTVVVLMIAYLLFMQYVSFGLPGVPYRSNMHNFLTGSSVASQILKLEREIEQTSGERPVVVGMDRHYFASQFGFYRERAKEANEAIPKTAGRNLFGRESLMYRFWTNPEDYEGRSMILIGRSSDQLSPDLLRLFFRSFGQLQDLRNEKNGYVVGHFYYRVAHGYHRLLSDTSMRTTDEWRDRTFKGPAYKKIMVVALTKRADLRQSVEDQFSRQLKARGDEAVACYECIPDVDKISREELAKVSAGKGIEAYLIVSILRTDTRVEAYRSSSPQPLVGLDMDSVMNMDLSGSSDPPMRKRSEVATLEARLYDGKSTKLIWRSTVESVDPSWDGSGIPKFVLTVLAALEDEKLILQSK